MSKSDGKFEKNNPIGKETRFKAGHSLSCKYKDEYCHQMITYFKENEALFPTFELFAEQLGVTHNTLLNWREKHPHFWNAYERCKNIQLGNLKVNTLLKRYDTTFAKFMCINNFGMTEKVENDSNITLNVLIPDEVDEESN